MIPATELCTDFTICVSEKSSEERSPNERDQSVAGRQEMNAGAEQVMESLIRDFIPTVPRRRIF